MPKKILRIKRPYFPERAGRYWLLNTDTTPLLRPYSVCLPGRRYVYQPLHQQAGNKPVGVGYECSVVGLSARSASAGAGPWNLPLSMRIVSLGKNRNSLAAEQINDLFDNPELPFGESLTLNALDSNYAAPEYIFDTHAQPNLVNIIRLASNRNVWKQSPVLASASQPKRGAKKIYGQKYQLSAASEWQLPPDTEKAFDAQLANGKDVAVRIKIWEDMLVRTKRGKSMKQKCLRLVRIELLNRQSQEPVFKRPLWLGVWGQRRTELHPEEIYQAYRNRFDIEHFFRFGKQRLLLDKFQTPEEDHWQNWMEVVSLAYWLLWAASDETPPNVKKWQQYDKNFKRRKALNLKPAPSTVQQQLEGIILSFEQEPFIPKVKIIGKGRLTGTVLQKRKRHAVHKNPKKIKIREP